MMRNSEKETLQHIRRVQQLLNQVVGALLERARLHDESKLSDPEVEVFEEYTSRLKSVTYGSEEYQECLAGMKPALDHHYRMNRHHPECHDKGVEGMSLIDLIEMLVDWKAASERHTDGDIHRSIRINQTRFGYGDALASIFTQSAYELWPTSL